MNEQTNPALRAEDGDELPVHPHADLFPMLSDEELDDLAADIKKNGLKYPLVVQEIDGVLTLIDGRNRREACRRAGVTPKTMLLNGEDATAYIVSTNIARRNITKGQQAMLVAMMYPEPEKTHRGKKSEAAKSTEFGTLSKNRIHEARTVLRHAPDKATLVLAGTEKLDAAYKEVQDIQRDAKNEQSQLQKLRAEAPDLATKVEEGELELAQANQELFARREKALIDRQGMFLTLNSGMTFARTYGDFTGDFSRVSGHWDEFSSATGTKRRELIAALEQLYRNIPHLLAALCESED